MGVGRCDKKEVSVRLSSDSCLAASYGKGFLSKDNDKSALSFASFLKLAAASHDSKAQIFC